jgi:hypothetical protein
MNDVQKMIYGTIIGFFLVLVTWFSLIFVSSCGFSLSCNQAAPIVVRTSIPTLIPVSHPESQGTQAPALQQFDACQVSAADLIGAWVSAGSSETEPFPFSDVNGNPCEGTFAEDIQRLFMENNLWYVGAIGCTSCHNAELTERSGGLDLSSYQGILAGTNRSYEGATGTDILGGGNWDTSSLHDVLFVHGLVPEGHSPDVEPIGPVFIYAGHRTEEATGTPTVAVTPTP